VYFLKRAETSLIAGQLDETEKFIERALEEESGFLPALVMKARLAQRRDQRDAAIRLLESVVAQKNDVRGAVAGRAVREAEELLAELDAARAEYRKLVDAYVQRLLALAHDSLKRKPQLAAACYQQVLAVQPDNPEALKNGKLPVAPDAKAAPEVPGTSLLNGKDLDNWKGVTSCWTFEDRVCRARLNGIAQIVRCEGDVKGDYEYICELRFIESMGKDPTIGLLFGGRDDYDHFGLWIFKGNIRLERQTEKGVRSEYQRKAVANLAKGFTRDAWHTYRIAVKSKRITVYVDGKEIYSSAAADRLPEGFVGLWAQDALIEIRQVSVVR
jgi:tetratricopeptide (TPR) repeat protein